MSEVRTIHNKWIIMGIINCYHHLSNSQHAAISFSQASLPIKSDYYGQSTQRNESTASGLFCIVEVVSVKYSSCRWPRNGMTDYVIATYVHVRE